ncbi:hypothetical protein B0H10DRAFT_2192568 [Mycena sp. CBHHK59/15]|nr:hypothetical protein B0H10DRAFT_2192568 [Mycena sp. CBHHK59/15]
MGHRAMRRTGVKWAEKKRQRTNVGLVWSITSMRTDHVVHMSHHQNATGANRHIKPGRMGLTQAQKRLNGIFFENCFNGSAAIIPPKIFLSNVYQLNLFAGRCLLQSVGNEQRNGGTRIISDLHWFVLATELANSQDERDTSPSTSSECKKPGQKSGWMHYRLRGHQDFARLIACDSGEDECTCDPLRRQLNICTCIEDVWTVTSLTYNWH